jgi:hypothetical protein
MLLPTPPANSRLANPPTREMPPGIESVLKGKPIFDPSMARPEYAASKALWQLYLDLLEPDGSKVAAMVDKHDPKEDPAKFALRQSLAVAFNLVPTLSNMLKGYLFATQPVIETGGDADLDAFLDDCDGAGTSYVQYCRETVLPLAMVMGHLDVLVQNPLVIGDIRTAQDAADVNARPTVFAITPLQRINWSSTLQGEYNWLCFTDLGNENPGPLFRNLQIPTSYITVSAGNDQFPNPDGKGLWIRSWLPYYINLDGKQPDQAAPGQFVSPTPEANPTSAGRFVHEADWSPTSCCPVATIYWQKSNDPSKRHMGVSKIAMIALLTRKIINVLSWVDEDVLANLSILLVPTKGGQRPKTGIEQLTSFSVLSYDNTSRHPPSRLEGNVSHIKAKLQLIDTYVVEILRLSHLTFGTEARAERVTSGVQAIVQRNELFQELKDAAGNLDRFTLDVLALVKSWATGEEWTVDRLTAAGVSVEFNNGPYLLNTAGEAMNEAAGAIAMFRNVSPALCVRAYEDAAASYLGQDDPALEQVLKEIADNALGQLAADSESAILAEAAAIGMENVGSTVNISEQAPASVDGTQTAAMSPAPKAAP